MLAVSPVRCSSGNATFALCLPACQRQHHPVPGSGQLKNEEGPGSGMSPVCGAGWDSVGSWAGGTFCGVRSITWSPGCHAGRSGCLQMLPGDADGDVSSVRKSTNHLGITDHGQGSAFCSWGKTLALMRTPRKTLIYTGTSWWI